MDRDIALAKRIEVGLLAQEMLDQGGTGVAATAEELATLAAEGRAATEALVLAHLGLVRVIAAEVARARRIPFADLFQEGCVALQQAVMSYDWRKGPFGPYAGLWIRAGVRRITRQSWVSLDDVELEDESSRAVLDRSLTRQGLGQVLSLIPPSERAVLRLRAGWSGQPQSRQATASQLGLTVARVRRLERSGLDTVRQCWALGQAA